MRGQDNNTPLHLAAEKNSAEAVGLLLAAKASVTTKNSVRGEAPRTPVRIALENSAHAAVKLLRAAGGTFSG